MSNAALCYVGSPRGRVSSTVCAGRAPDTRAGHAAVPGARRRRDVHTHCVGGPMGSSWHLWLCVSACPVSTSNARPARPREQPRRRRPAPTQASCATCKGRLTTRHRGTSRAAAQRIMTRREYVGLPSTLCTSVPLPGAPAPASWLHRSVHRRHSSSQRPEGQFLCFPKGSTGSPGEN